MSDGSPLTSGDELENGPAAVDLQDALATLAGDLRAHDERSAAAQRTIDRLHDENEKLRVGERQLLLRPVQVDLQRLRNDLLRQAETLPADLTTAQAADLLSSFAVTVELVLERCGVEVVRPVTGVAFDAGAQRAVGTVPAPSPELDSVVAECLADGYRDTVTQRVIAPASVRVYRWEGQLLTQLPAARSGAE